jgi:hypothetical protein
MNRKLCKMLAWDSRINLYHMEMGLLARLNCGVVSIWHMEVIFVPCVYSMLCQPDQITASLAEFASSSRWNHWQKKYFKARYIPCWKNADIQAYF